MSSFVLIACEESQVMCSAFRLAGFNAFSCDLQPCSGGHPEWHIQGDVVPLINGKCTFFTCDGTLHVLPGTWDLIIAHPPCTYLSAAGACRLYPQAGVISDFRFRLGQAARDFFMLFFHADCPHVCIENPRPLSVFSLPGCSQVINPCDFGESYTKRTYLWLKGLPPLFSTDLVRVSLQSWTSLTRSPKVRSRSFPGIAAAMVSQWSCYLEQ